MNGTGASLAEIGSLIDRLQASSIPRADVLVCPPITLLFLAHELMRDSGIALGAQDCHVAASGAHTGDISAEMLADAGATYVIVGHSERRADHGETSALVRAKAEAAHRAGLVSIICIGEIEAERRAGRTLKSWSAAPSIAAFRATRQQWSLPMSRSGLSAQVSRRDADIAEVHGFIRNGLAQRPARRRAQARILYGGR
jgi:triosephosphate isomerase